MTAEVIYIKDRIDDLYHEGKISMESLMRHEMIAEGYNPAVPDDVEQYWNDIMDTKRDDQ